MAFAVFGAGSLLVALTVFPLLNCFSRTQRDREIRAQRLIHLSFLLFLRFTEALGLIRVTRRDMNRLRDGAPCVVVANHPTLIDVVLLIGSLPQADCVVKQGVWRNPFLRRVVATAGYIPNDTGRGFVDTCVSRLRDGRLVLLFPEGTRSPQGHLGAFHRGAARIALKSGCDLVPVLITCEPPSLMKGQPWYKVPDRTIQLALQVEAPIRLPPEQEAPAGLAARRLTAELRTRFARKVAETDARA